MITGAIKRVVYNPSAWLLTGVIATLAFVLFLVVAIPEIQREAKLLVVYNDLDAQTVTPLSNVLCPGDVMNYSVSLNVTEPNALVTVYESWCHPDGFCPYDYSRDPSIIVGPDKEATLSGPATRIVPDLPPGEWEFRHRNRAETSHGGLLHTTFSGYTIRITVPENCGTHAP